VSYVVHMVHEAISEVRRRPVSGVVVLEVVSESGF